MIRMRLLVGFVLVALLPLFGVGVGTYIVNYRSGRQQSVDRLESVAARKELAIQGWVKSLQDELSAVLQADFSPKLFSTALRLADEGDIYPWYLSLVRKRLQGFVDQSSQFDELFLMDQDGRVLVSTEPTRDGVIYQSLSFFNEGLRNPYTWLPFSSNTSIPGAAGLSWNDLNSAFGTIPIRDVDGRILGTMTGRGKIDSLHAILDERTSLGDTGKAYLVDSQGTLLSGTNAFLERGDLDTVSQGMIQTEGISNGFLLKASASGVYQDPLGVKVIGVYRRMPELGAVLAVEQDFSETFQVVATTLGINLVIALTAIALAVFASLLLTRSIADPIIDLADTASQIAKGDFDRTANTDRKDEVGVLGRAFNSMTVQLRDLINTLEKRVAERTYDLQLANEALNQRALQMETSAQVGREITSILNLDVLLARVVDLIQDSFGYYHVQVFLLDKDASLLVLRANSGGGNPKYRQISLDQSSINSRAALSGKPVMVNDVSQEVYFLYDEQLPDTRSELAIPLRLGEQVIGTLDVHAAVAGAFTEQDVLVIQGLGDQIVVAIENARLYDQSRELAISGERTRLARELHDSVIQSLYSLVLLTEGWRRQLHAGGSAVGEDYLSKIGAIAQDSLKEMRMLIYELRPPKLQQEGLVGALRNRLDVVENKVGIEGRVVMEDFIELPAYIEDGLYWIAQEALNNAMKHANASREIVNIRVDDGNVILEVTDNGIGFEVETAEKSGGMGLSNMNDRARRMGGSFLISSEHGEGTVVKVIVPLLAAVS